LTPSSWGRHWGIAITFFIASICALGIGQETAFAQTISRIVFSGNCGSEPWLTDVSAPDLKIARDKTLSGSLASLCANRLAVTEMPNFWCPVIVVGGTCQGNIDGKTTGEKSFPVSVSHPAFWNAPASITAKCEASGTCLSYRTITLPFGRSFIDSANMSALTVRNSFDLCTWSISRAISSSASTSRLLDSVSSAFDRRRSSVWMRASFRLKITSPIMPKAIAASIAAVSIRSQSEPYGSGKSARITSANTAAATNPAQPHSQRSHDDEASFSWVSVAFIVPFGKRHAGKEFRGFWTGVAIGALMFGLLFFVSHFYK